jgi:hypothetical protein
VWNFQCHCLTDTNHCQTIIFLTILITACYLKYVHLWHHLWTKECCKVWRYRSFVTRVSQLKIWFFFLVIGIERHACRCTFNRYSVITQFAKVAAGEQLCRRCTHRSYSTSKPLKVSPAKSHILICNAVVQMSDVKFSLFWSNSVKLLAWFQASAAN